VEEAFKVERYRRSNRDEVLDLVRAAFPPAFAQRTVSQWDWKYDANPFNAEAADARRAAYPRLSATIRAAASDADLGALDADYAPENSSSASEPYCLLLRTEGTLAGMIGAIPQRFLIGERQYWVSDGCDFVVHPRFRGRQLSVRLGKVLAADNAIIQGWSNAAGRGSARSLLRRLRGAASLKEGFHSTRMRLTPLFKPIDVRALAEYLSDNHLLRSGIEVLVGSLTAVRKRFVQTSPSLAINVVETDSVDSWADRLWDRSGHDHAIIGVRDRRYLNWRFVSRPDASYRYLVAARADEIVGYLVFRLAPRDGLQCGFIVDYLVADRSSAVFGLLLSAAEARMTRAGAKAIICAIAPARYRSLFWRHGYYPARMGSTPYLEAGAHRLEPSLELFADLRRWFVTMGDGNLELSY
jgi:hypothetical protein